MKPLDPEQFSAELDRILAGKAVDARDLSPEDARALEVARQAAMLETPAAVEHKQRLRQQLQRRAFAMRRARSPILTGLWATWMGLAILGLLFINGAFNGLAPLSTPARAAQSTAWVSTAQLEPAPASRPQPNAQLHPYEIPRPVPTPLAPPGTTLPAFYPAGYIPGGHGAIATP